MGLRDIGATLPPGFRFYPSDEELVCHYLYKKICNEQVLKGTLVEIDLHTCEPWQLPDVAKLNASEWYFFSFRDRKYATGYRTNRATTSGYWKATGKDRTVINPLTKEVVGMRKTLVFYKNRAPNGVKTGWIMHEFRLETPNMPPKEDWVLCRVFHKSKGPESSTEVPSSPQHNMLTENMNYTSSCFPNSLNLASSATPTTTNDHHNQTMPNYGYNRYDQMMTSSTSTYHDRDQSGSPNGSNSLHHHHHDQKLGANNRNMATGNNNPASTTDAFGYLWDSNLDENGLENQGLHSNFVDYLRFEINDNNNNVFL